MAGLAYSTQEYVEHLICRFDTHLTPNDATEDEPERLGEPNAEGREREIKFKRTVANSFELAKRSSVTAWDGLLISRFSVRVRGGSPQNQVQFPNDRSKS